MTTYFNYDIVSSINITIWADIICFLAILSSLLVISTSNPVISVLFLISLFINIAVYLVLIGITYIGLTYIVVYVGAVTILFLFVIMLLDIKLSEIKLDSDNSSGFPLGMILGISFLYPIMYNKFNIINFSPDDSQEIYLNLLNIILDLNNKFTGFKINSNLESLSPDFINTNINNNLQINESFNKTIHLLWDNNIYTYYQITSIGNILYTSYAIWFILIGLILLLAMIGAISLTLKPLK